MAEPRRVGAQVEVEVQIGHNVEFPKFKSDALVQVLPKDDDPIPVDFLAGDEVMPLSEVSAGLDESSVDL